MKDISVCFYLEGTELIADVKHQGGAQGMQLELDNLNRRGRDEAALGIGTFVLSFISIAHPDVLKQFPNINIRYPKGPDTD